MIEKTESSDFLVTSGGGFMCKRGNSLEANMLIPRSRRLAAAVGVLLAFSGMAGLGAAELPRFPFPQAKKSQYLKPPSAAQSSLNKACLASWKVIREKLITNEGCEAGEFRIVVDAHDFGGSVRPTYSEGIA